MELVPTYHTGVSCDGCLSCPIVGSRFKCKSCDNVDLCERCFYHRRGGNNTSGGSSQCRQHTFNRIAEPGSPAVFAGEQNGVNEIAIKIKGNSLMDNKL